VQKYLSQCSKLHLIGYFENLNAFSKMILFFDIYQDTNLQISECYSLNRRNDSS